MGNPGTESVVPGHFIRPLGEEVDQLAADFVGVGPEHAVWTVLALNHCGSALLLHETPDELRDLIRGRIEREVARIEHVDFGRRHVAAIVLRL